MNKRARTLARLKIFRDCKDKPASPRQGWGAAFKRMHQAGEDKPLLPADLDAHLLEKRDEN